VLNWEPFGVAYLQPSPSLCFVLFLPFPLLLGHHKRTFASITPEGKQEIERRGENCMREVVSTLQSQCRSLYPWKKKKKLEMCASLPVPMEKDIDHPREERQSLGRR
jgi:hypothetical protein